MVNRQGFAMQYNHDQIDSRLYSPGGDANSRFKNALLVESGSERLPSVTSLDFRVGKEFAWNRARFNLDLDVFNLLNSATVLGRQYNLRVSTANNVLEIMNPRVLRLGARFSF
jgi:hypothetical protein